MLVQNISPFLKSYISAKNSTYTKKQENGIDVFIKTLKTSNSFGEAQIISLYNNVYAEVMSLNKSNNAVLNEVTINKPVLIFDDDSNDNYFARYSPVYNTISLNLKNYNSDMYAVLSYDDSGKAEKVCWIGTQDNLEEALNSAKTKQKNVKAIKFNDDEKKIFLESAFAHEIRHCIQDHLILSCEGGFKEEKEIFKDAKNAIIEANKDDEDINFYILDYKPNKILDKDAKFKVSLNKEDNRYWSIYSDFFDSRSTYKEDKNNINEEKYNSNIKEIDAHGFQKEYLCLKIPEYKKTSARYDILLALIAYF